MVTGASSGIGLEFAKLLAADSYDLILAARDKAALTKVAAELQELHGITATPISIDLSIQGAADALWDKVGKRPVAVLVNSAGFGNYADVVDSDPKKLESMIALNITCTTRLSQLAAASMKKRGTGNIVNFGSILSFFPSPHNAVYGATKAYVLQFSEALNEELAGSGAHVTVLCPGPTKTGFAKAASIEKASVMNGNLPTAQTVAQFGYNAMKQNKTVAVHGFRTKVFALVGPRIFTRARVRKIVGKVQSE